MVKLKDLVEPTKILVVITNIERQILNEATRATVGRYTARRDQPHFSGDQYHAHADLPKGYQVAWNIDGSKRHVGKFPKEIPNDAKAAVAKVLGVRPDILETFQWYDEALKENIYIVEFKTEKGDGEKNLPAG